MKSCFWCVVSCFGCFAPIMLTTNQDAVQNNVKQFVYWFYGQTLFGISPLVRLFLILIKHSIILII